MRIMISAFQESESFFGSQLALQNRNAPKTEVAPSVALGSELLERRLGVQVVVTPREAAPPWRSPAI